MQENIPLVESAQQDVRLLLIAKQGEDARLVLEYASGAANPAFQVHRVSRLSEALVHIEQTPPQIVLASLELEDCQGMPVVLALRQTELPLVILASLKDSLSSFDGGGDGLQEHLIRGQFDRQMFLRVIRYAMERSRILKERDAAHRTVQHLVTSDPLTGLSNRRGLEDLLKEAVQAAGRLEHGAFAFLLNLDNFKSINDTFGHAVGDIVLKEMGRRIREVLAMTGSAVARVSGDEFMVVLGGLHEEEAILMTEKVRLSVSQSAVGISESQNVFITATIGLVQLVDENTSVDELLQRLRYTLSKGKKSHKNTVNYPRSRSLRLGSREDEASILENVIDLMVSGQGFYAVSQPLTELETRAVIGREYFGRLSLQEFLMPEDFFRIAREARILTVVDRFCLKACIAAASAQEADGACQVHVNLYPSTLLDVSAEQLAREFGIGLGVVNYCVEISEQQVIMDPSYLVEPVRALKKAGIGVAMDDVGFGRSCLENLILLEPDVVKIDKRWIQGIDKDPTRRKMLKKLLRIVAECEARAIAEGVETEEERRALLDLGVRYGQGYLFGRPARPSSS